jgi:hypothetical protein
MSNINHFRKAALVILFSIAVYFTQAQGFSLGPQLGANIVRIDGVELKDGYNLSYHAGAYASIKLGEKFNAQMELLWSQLTAKRANNFQDVYQQLENQNWADPKLDYFTIPVTLNFKPGKLISFQAGAQYGILFNKNISLVDNGKDAFNKGEVSGLVGVNLHVLGFRIYGRYVFSVSNVAKFEDLTNTLSNENTWKTSVIQVGAAFAIL